MTVEERTIRRAKLKIFFGYAPGVGKTYKMLESARALAAEGVDVVVGAVEPHGRYDTAALLLGLDILERRRVVHRAAELADFDLEAALARRPRVLLVDELAHTNAPGGRHPRRWQDVLDLLEAGIDVHTTLNVQHVESLNDVVAQVTSIRVRETVPDVVLDRADEIELCDLTPDQLLDRLAEGKVYVPEQVRRAADRLFERGSLLALRELAMRRAADRLDVDVRQYREVQGIETTWPTAERILVGVGPSPASARLVRAGCRMAAGLRASWIAAYVERGGLAPLGAVDRERLESHLRLADSLGAEVVHLAGSRPSQVLLDYARRHNVTRILVGKPTHARWRDLLRGSLLDEIVRGSAEIDVLAISGDAKPEVGPARPRERERLRVRGYLWTAGLVALATLAAWLSRQHLASPDLVMVYLLVIAVAALRFGRGPAVAAAALSVAVYDIFFVVPYYTFAVAEARHIFTFVTMFAVGLTISELTLRARRQERQARAREARTAALYALSRDLGSVLDLDGAAEVTARHAAAFFDASSLVLLPDQGGRLSAAASGGGEMRLGDEEREVAGWVMAHGRAAGRTTDTHPDADVLCAPLQAGPERHGVLVLGRFQGTSFPVGERHFLDTFGRQAALALERARLADAAKAAALRANTEEMRSSLLSAVSHDLRTPLAAIVGAASTLRERARGEEAEMLAAICEEAERLERLVGNLLDMTRLDSGAVTVRRDWLPVEEVVGGALGRLERLLDGRPVRLDLPADLPLVSVDPVLLEQVFVNLFENAARYTPAGSPIEVGGRAGDAVVEIEVADRGPGLPPGQEVRMFEKFVRGHESAGRGVGLGLAICRAIVLAHGGTISGENRPDGGARFRVRLPRVGPSPVVPAESDPLGETALAVETR